MAMLFDGSVGAASLERKVADWLDQGLGEGFLPVVWCMMVWSALYFLLVFVCSKRHSAEWNSRLVASLHALVILVSVW